MRFLLCPASLDEGFENNSGCAVDTVVVLGMPLYAEEEGMRGIFHCFNGAVILYRCHDQAGGNVLDRLMVETVDVHAVHADQPVQASSGFYGDMLRPFGSGDGGLAMAVNVLVERAAASDIEKLNAAANTEDRLAAVLDRLVKGKFKGIAGLVYLDALTCDLLAVIFWPDIHTPREMLSIPSVERTYRLVCEALREMA